MSTKTKIATLLQLLLITAQPLYAGVTLDGTLGVSGSITGPNYAITSDLGKQSGTNLFHSFSTFDLIKGDIATFSGPTNISNIISRVTGGSASSIDGTLKSTISGANMYFLNPAGIIFGPNASLDLSGSFHVSTADYLKLGTDGRFDVAAPANSVLTTSPPSAFGFVAAKPAGITVNGAGSDYAYSEYGLYGLYVKTGNTISIIGGDISFNSGTIDNQTVPFYLMARGGRLNLASVASSGEVVIENANLAMNGFTSLGNILLGANGIIDLTSSTSTGSSGNIYIRGNNLESSSFIIGAFSTDSYIGGNIDVRLDGDLNLDNTAIYSGGSQSYKANSATISDGSKIIAYGERDITIDTNKFDLVGVDSSIKSIYEGTNKGGSINLTASDYINIGQGSFISGNATVLTTTTGVGSSGAISLTAPTITLKNYADVSSTTTSAGNGGDIIITATDLSIGNGATISGMAGSPLADVTGKSANITIKTDTLSMTGGSFYGLDSAAISNNCYGSGGCGNITIDAAKSLTMNGNSFLQNASITSVSNVGKAGSILITAPDMTLKNGVYISSSTSDGQSGEITLTADRITFQGGEITTGTSASGSAGSIFVTAGEKLQVGGNTASTNSVNTVSQIDSLTLGSGNAGSISITGKEVVIGSKGRVAVTTEDTTGISTGSGGNISVVSDSLSLDGGTLLAYTKGSGNAGTVDVNAAGSISIVNGGVISSSTYSTGDAGSVKVNADSILIDGQGSSSVTGIYDQATSGSSGNAGSIEVTTTGLLSLLNGGVISSSTYSTGDAGSVKVNAGTLSVDGAYSGIGAQASADSSGQTGSVNVAASEITLSNGGGISISNEAKVLNPELLTPTLLTVTAKTLDINGGTITAETRGNVDAGNVEVKVAEAANITNSGSITSETFAAGIAGSVTVSAGTLNLSNGGLISTNAQTDSSGNAGNVNIQSSSITLTDNALISSESLGSGKAGNLDIKAVDNLNLTDSSITTATVNADGGSITIDPVLVHLKNSSITTSVKGGTGSGGNIDLTAKQLVIDNSKIVAQADAGNGGNINLNAGVIIQSLTGSEISASSNKGVQGSVVLSSPVIDASAALVEMPSALRDIASLSPRRCITSGDDISSFVIYACGSPARQPDAAIIGK